MTQEEFTALKENIRRLRILWKEMRSRCSNPNAMDYQWYGAKGVKVCDEWSGPDGSDAFVVWSLKHGYEWHRGIERGDQMSIDRLDPDKDYCPENCRYIPLRDNCLRATRRRLSNTTTYQYAMNWNGRNLKYRSMFPDCVRKGTPNANGSVDWTKVFDNYFSTTEEFEEWLYNEGFSKVTILAIRRKLNKRCASRAKRNRAIA